MLKCSAESRCWLSFYKTAALFYYKAPVRISSQIYMTLELDRDAKSTKIIVSLSQQTSLFAHLKLI